MSIAEFYKGKTVFLSGISGFIGRIILSKMLRSADVKEVLLLMRPKRGKSNEERLDKIFDIVLFDEVKKRDKNFREKIRVINGDLELEMLGISAEDQDYIKNKAEIFIHGAATVRFDEDLKKALTINVKGSKIMIDLALATKNLLSFVYISTAYSNCPLSRIKESFYESPMKYQEALEVIEKFDSNTLDALTPRLIFPWPNTYTFSKAIAEDLMRQHLKVLPIGIVRPTIVQTTFKDPVHGFGDKIIGPIGLAVGVASGIVRIVRTNPRSYLDIVPADIVTNATLAVGWKVAQKDVKNQPIYVSSICNVRKTTISFALNYIADHAYESPTKRMIWLPRYNETSCDFMYRFYFIVYHYLPAMIFDMYLRFIGSKHRLFNVYSKIFEQSKLLNYFILKSWHFEDSNMKELFDSMDAKDKDMFPLTVQHDDYEKHAVTGSEGLRRYFFKENDEDLKIARKKYKIFRVLHYLLLGVVYSGLFLATVKLLDWMFMSLKK